MAITGGTIQTKLALDTSKFKGGLKGAMGSVKSFASGVGKVMGVAIVAGAAALTKMVLSAAKIGDLYDKMSKRTGTTVEFLTGAAHAAELAGTNVQTFEKGINRLQSTIQDSNDGLSTARTAFARIGISPEQVAGFKNAQEAFFVIQEKLAAMTDPMERNATAADLFGKAGIQLLPMLNQQTSVLKEQFTEGTKLLGLTKEGAEQAALFSDEMSKMGKVWDGLVLAIGIGLMPHLRVLVTMVKDWMMANRDWLKTKIVGAVIILVRAFKILVAVWGLVMAGIDRIKAGFILMVGAIVFAVEQAVNAVVTALNWMGRKIHSALAWTGLVGDKPGQLKKADFGGRKKLEMGKDVMREAESARTKALVAMGKALTWMPKAIVKQTAKQIEKAKPKPKPVPVPPPPVVPPPVVPPPVVPPPVVPPPVVGDMVHDLPAKFDTIEEFIHKLPDKFEVKDSPIIKDPCKANEPKDIVPLAEDTTTQQENNNANKETAENTKKMSYAVAQMLMGQKKKSDDELSTSAKTGFVHAVEYSRREGIYSVIPSTD